MTPGEHYRFGPFQLDVAERELRQDGEVIPLTAKTLDLLLILVEGAGRTFTKAELMESLWPGAVVEESNLSQTIFLLRKALGGNGDGSGYILTVPRRGYKFIGSVSRPDGVRDRSGVSGVSRWLRPSIAAAAVLAALWITVIWLRQPRPLDLSTYRYRPFAFAKGTESIGRWSPDGKSVTFLEGLDLLNTQGLPARHLMVQPAEGGGATELAAIEHNLWNCCRDTAWSPDGSRIYFARPNGIYSISPAGGQPELILKQTNPFYFDLSPDGKAFALRLALPSPDHSWRGSVWISSPPGAELKEYSPAPFAVHAALGPDVLRFSPDGKSLYLSIYSFSGNSVETWILPFPSGVPRQIFRNVRWRETVGASWMRDSRRMVFSGSIAPSTVRTLWLADVRAESLVRLTDESSNQQDPDISPDGRRLLFTRVAEDADLVELPLNGSPAHKLLATTASEFSPVWSPKGGEFAYLTRRNGSDELWLRSSQGDWERPLVTTNEFPMLMWLNAGGISPDGSHIAYGAVLRDPNRPLGAVYVSPTAGGAPTWIANGGGSSWSPDGASLALWWLKPDGVGLLATVRVGSSQPPFEIPNVACSPSTPAWSPSGEWIACNTALGVMLVSPDGKVRRTLPRLNVPPVWSKDSQTLYGLDGANGLSWLVAEDVRTGAIRKVADYGSEIIPYSGGHGPARRLNLSPDGKSVALGTVKRQTALWILEGFPQ